MALHDFVGEGEHELTIRDGQLLLVLAVEDNGWCLAQIYEEKPTATELPAMGWVPLAYVSQLEDDGLEALIRTPPARTAKDYPPGNAEAATVNPLYSLSPAPATPPRAFLLLVVLSILLRRLTLQSMQRAT